MAELDDVAQDVDAVTFEVIRHRLLSITEDRTATLAAVSGSPFVNEATDFASEHSSHESRPTAQQRPSIDLPSLAPENMKHPLDGGATGSAAAAVGTSPATRARDYTQPADPSDSSYEPSGRTYG